jgi:hypothetical protein
MVESKCLKSTACNRARLTIVRSLPFNAKAERGSTAKTTYFAQIPLEKFPVGRYTVQVNVLDPGTARVAFTRLPMAVVKPPPRVPRSGGGQ